MYLKFFVLNSSEEVKMKELEKILLGGGFQVRSEGKANFDEIAFFPSSEIKGFSFAAHKFFCDGVPYQVEETPFLVKVGEKWSKMGLWKIIKNYAAFQLPPPQKQNPQRWILHFKNKSINLPWSDCLPQGRNKDLLIDWIKKANSCFVQESPLAKMENYSGLKKIYNIIEPDL